MNYTWHAGSDGIAHAAHPGHARTICNVRSQDPRWAWPEQSRCADCQAIDVWPTVRRVNVHRKHEETRMTTLEPRIERKMKAAKPPSTTIEFGPGQNVRVSGRRTDELTFASRSALEDVLTDVFRQGIAVGWASGQLALTQEGQVIEDKRVTRDAEGRIVGLINTMKVVLPGGALMTVPKPKGATK